MKCPNCGKKPISFMQFIMTSIPSNIHCASCDTELKPNNVIKGMIFTGYILGGILGLVLIMLAMRNG